jgi:hypothetical protein
VAPEAEKGFSMLTAALKKIRKQMAKDAAKLSKTEMKIKAKAEAGDKPRRAVVNKVAGKAKKSASTKKRKR